MAVPKYRKRENGTDAVLCLFINYDYLLGQND